MKALNGLVGAAFAAVLMAAPVGAQEPPVQAPPPQARLRQHVPGTGLQEGMIPQHQRLGAWGGMGGGAGMYAPRHLLAQKDLLQLSEDQVGKLEKLDTQFAEQRGKDVAELRTRQQALRDAWSAADPDLGLVRDRLTAVIEAEQAVQLSRLDADANAKAILTQEQLGKVRSFAQGYRMGAGVRWGGRGMRGGMAPGGRWPGGRGGMPRYRMRRDTIQPPQTP